MTVSSASGAGLGIGLCAPTPETFVKRPDSRTSKNSTCVYVDGPLGFAHSYLGVAIMENPSNWGKVRRTIDRAIEKNKLEGEDGRLGRSLVSTIYDELHASGYIAEDEPDE